MGCSIAEAFELMHHRLDNLVHPDDRCIVEPYFNASELSHCEAYSIEYRIIRADGEVRYVAEIAEPMYGNDGKPVEYAGTLQDITERKTIETQLLEICRRLQAVVSEKIYVNGLELFVNCSIGFSVIDHQTETLEESIVNADIALYKAKYSENKEAHRYLPKMGEELAYRKILEHDLRFALERGELSVVYQPKVLLQAGDQPLSVEALVRWQHTDLGNISPDVFIPIAESNGLIHDISQFVLNKSCMDIAAVSRQLGRDVSVAVNFSVAQFYDANLMALVESVLLDSQLKPSQRIVKGVVQLAISLNLTVVGEGVETHEQADFLRSVGCDIAQGYLYGKPMLLDDLLTYYDDI